MSRFTDPIAGFGRTFARTAAGMTMDLASAAARAGEVAVDTVTGRDRGVGVLRVQVLILTDEAGTALSTPEQITPALTAADRILRAGTGVRVRVTGIRTIAEVPPAAALDPRANRGLVVDDILGRTEFYRRHLRDRDGPADPAFVGAPITVIVVREIAGHTTGCSLGISADWVITQASLYNAASENSYDETVLAHELGHALNLPHHRDRTNLMFPESSPPHRVRGTALSRWQRGVVQANRHVLPGGREPGRSGPASDLG
ncbi:hypothetical protein SAMN04515671_3857 [Nakamurella panacisegetis]|uniref:Peptidase M10 metallopeptidase domain-containing protein n=1 Tax=Nakamurella panacisegetis TaxID=1090615 RepID=A0A1H0S1H4_9ACTN|nr:matrixin family metalloprotease [Nakamurella panacisegetis]SDP35573.1 hypothetical protein SAMN04515671_3857 [Nakamurella panacisegetis]